MEFVILKTQYWKALLNPDQSTLGRCIVGLKRKCPNLSLLKEKEQTDFFRVVKSIESSIKKSFSAESFNWTCLMNDAYKTNPPSPQVHWHCRPRYRKPVIFEGIKFEDLEFAHHYNNKRHFRIEDKNILEKISMKISANL